MGVEGGGRLPGVVKPPGGGTENAREGGGAHDCWLTGGTAKRCLAVLRGAPENKFGCCWKTGVWGALIGAPRPR